MSLEEGLSLISFAFEQEEDSLLFQRWVNGAQYQMSFDEFKAQLIPKPQKSEKEIFDDVEKIMVAFDGGDDL